MEYEAWIRGNEHKCFDSTRQRGKPLEFRCGTDVHVIDALHVGIIGCHVGHVVEICSPPEYGYGSQGIPSLIPPNSDVVFEVEILHACDDLLGRALLDSYKSGSISAIEDMKPEDLLKGLRSLIDYAHFVCDGGMDYHKAILLFQSAIDISLTYPSCTSEEEVEELERIASHCFGAFGGCEGLLGKFGTAIKAFLQVSVKGYPAMRFCVLRLLFNRKSPFAVLQGLLVNPKDENMRCSLAALYIDLKDYTRARRQATKALRYNPHNNEAVDICEFAKTRSIEFIGEDSHERYGVVEPSA